MNIKKNLKRVLLLLLLLVCLFGWYLYHMKKGQSMPEFIFPQPTGCYAVGTKLFELTDPTRNDPETSKPRELVVQVWYPSTLKLRRASPGQGKPADATAPYAYEALETNKRAFAKQGVGAEKMRLLDGIRTHAIHEAPACIQHAPYPVVIFAHGNSAPRGSYSFFCEDIASQGYVVAMVMHTGVTSLIRFADGRKVTPTRETKVSEVIEECFADVVFMLDRAIAGDFGPLTPVCDFDNIGMIGHSLGGMITAQVCRRDARVKAGINLDGTLWGINSTKPFHKPFMFIQSPNFYEDMIGVLDCQKDSLRAVGVTKETFNGSTERFCRSNGKDTIRIIVHGATHLTFSDDPILNDFFVKIFGSDVDLNKLNSTEVLSLPEKLDAIRGCILTFFNRHLKEQKAEFSSLVRHDPGQEDFDFYIPDNHPQHIKKEIKPKLLDMYVGQYRFGDVVFAITKNGNTLYTQIADGPQYPIYPESETTFFYTVADIQISFIKNEKGKVTKLIKHQRGLNQLAERID